MPHVFNPPSVIPDVGNRESMVFPCRVTRIKGQSRPSVIPDVSNPPSVIPDIFNRESMAFPMQAHSNKVTEKKDTGFPLTTGGMTEGDQQA